LIAIGAAGSARPAKSNKRAARCAALGYPAVFSAMPTPVVFNNTVLRDGHQSLAATRMTTAQMLPAAPLLDELGFGGLETWGGATIDSCLRFLGENPFDRLRALKKAAPKTPQIMLLRGQNIVQYTSFPDDVVEAFVRADAAAGQDVFRIFDALNDTRNLATAIRAVKACGKHARGEICYTTSPVHTVEAFVKMGAELEKLGCDSIGIKDMSGVLAPRLAFDLVKALKRSTSLPVTLHTHDTAGLGAAAYVAAVDAGVDAIETSIAPFANGTAQPDTVRMIALLEGHPRCPKFDTGVLLKLRQHFTEVYRELAKFTSTDNERVDSDTLCYQVPGGMLSNFRTQLREQNMMDKFDDVMREIPVVRAALGWIPLVTPTSQIVGTQAMLNVKFGRWKNLAQATNDIALGKYGRTPGPVDPALLELVVKKTGQKPIEGRLADTLPPRMDTLRAELAKAGLPTDDEACVLHAMFPREFAALHGPKTSAPVAPSPAPSAAKSEAKATGPARQLAITINGKRVVAAVEELA
jgi:oxaloacetate decarboxylase alpha subunit/pyruvate carboxylase subunit B